MRIANLKDLEKGKDIFIVGGGPSLLNVDLSYLSNKVVIGMNRSVILEKGFSSKYYVVSDKRFVENEEKFQDIEKILNTKTFIFREGLTNDFAKEDKKRVCTTKALGRDGFSRNIARGYYHSCTTTMLAIQVAYYLGAKRIFLLGIDLNYYGSKARSYDIENSEIPDAFLSYQIKNIVNAAIILERESIELINLSEKSFLKPYLKFKSFQNIK